MLLPCSVLTRPRFRSLCRDELMAEVGRQWEEAWRRTPAEGWRSQHRSQEAPWPKVEEEARPKVFGQYEY